MHDPQVTYRSIFGIDQDPPQWKSAFEEANAGLPSGLAEAFERAWQNAQSLPLPHVKAEKWRWLDFSQLRLADARVCTRPALKLDVASQPDEGELPGACAIPRGLIITTLSEAIEQHPDLVARLLEHANKHSPEKFQALTGALAREGLFVYVPKGVKVDLPLQAYFRLNVANIGQFERSIIIADEGSQVHYVEGCTAPQYTTDSFHSGVIEIFVRKGARVRYTTIQNWSTNVYNLVTQRARVEEDGLMEWVDCNLGSKVTMKYPSCYLMGPGARGEILSMAFAGPGQTQDAGGKIIHFASNTSSKITSKSISKGGGRSSYRGLVKVYEGAEGVRSNVVCDALILDPESRSDTYPYIEVGEQDVTVGHEATVSKVGEEQLFYLMSRGLSEEESTTMVVSGFIEPLVKELPMEYAVEMNRLIQLQMEGAVG